MAIKPPEILNRLPSVSELLDKPPIRALADRWNRSVVAGRVRSFLEEMSNDLRRRAADAQLPSVRELAERAARYVLAHEQRSLGAAINATGCLWGPEWTGRPIGDAALQQAVAVGREFVASSNSGSTIYAECQQKLCSLAGSEAALVVHSYPSAMWLALSALGSGREVVIARSEAGDIAPGQPLRKLAASASVYLREVGSADGETAADFAAAISSATAAVLLLATDGDSNEATTRVTFEELVSAGRERKLPLVCGLGAAPITDRPGGISWPGRSAAAAIAAGLDVVVIRGDGLVGGPASGLIIGNRGIVNRISEHPLFAALQLDRLRVAALGTTLEFHDSPDERADVLPVLQLLTTPVENLRNRAERLAQQLARAPGVASATVVETKSPITGSCSNTGDHPSYAVALSSADASADGLAEQLRQLPVPVFGRVDQDRLLLDLRTVLPRQDRVLVESVLGSTSAEEVPTGEPAEATKSQTQSSFDSSATN